MSDSRSLDIASHNHRRLYPATRSLLIRIPKSVKNAFNLPGSLRPGEAPTIDQPNHVQSLSSNSERLRVLSRCLAASDEHGLDLDAEDTVRFCARMTSSHCFKNTCSRLAPMARVKSDGQLHNPRQRRGACRSAS